MHKSMPLLGIGCRVSDIPNQKSQKKTLAFYYKDGLASDGFGPSDASVYLVSFARASMILL